jgi:hypothetical protein
MAVKQGHHHNCSPTYKTEKDLPMNRLLMSTRHGWREEIGPVPPDPSQVGVVITKIEDIFESITGCILDEGKELVIPLKSRPKKKKKKIANRDDGTQVNEGVSTEARSITFPSKSPQEAWKFSE